MLISVNAASGPKLSKEQLDNLRMYSTHLMHLPEKRDEFIKDTEYAIDLWKKKLARTAVRSPLYKQLKVKLATLATQLQLAKSGAPESEILDAWNKGFKKEDAFITGNVTKEVRATDLYYAMERSKKLKRLEVEYGIVEGTSSKEQSTKPAGKLKRTPQLLAAAVKASPAIRDKIKKIDDDLKTLRKELILAYRKRLKAKGKK